MVYEIETNKTKKQKTTQKMLSIRKIVSKTKQKQKKDKPAVDELTIEQGSEDAQQTCGCVV